MIDRLYEIVENQYFTSGDFNGMPINSLKQSFDIENEEFRNILKKAIEDEVLTATFHGNTHIRMFSTFPKEKILKWLETEDYPAHICLYPHANKLMQSEKLVTYKDKPYELELATGAGQLDYRTFELSVLEYYRNDPRYSYNTDFIHGSISIEDEYFESKSVAKHDQILLQTFGFAYDEEMNRYVAVFLRYLADLSGEHQLVWKAKEVKGSIKLHPDYYASSIEGSWGTKISIFDAFTQELKLINDMSRIIGKPILFLKDYNSDKPKEFGFLLRPTDNEFNNFIHLLDKMMSDNINKKFFENDVELETDKERDDGKIIVQQKGTLQILESWINKYFKPVDRKPLDKMFATFKEVRKLRQKPAHSVITDSFDQTHIHKQQKLILESYRAVRTLRMLLSNHPLVKSSPPDISHQLLKGEIWHI